MKPPVPNAVLPRWIAVDGPSGSGKSSAARGLAQRLGWSYLDTGATYRAATIAALEASVNLDAIVTTDPDATPASRDASAGAWAALAAEDLHSSTDPQAPGIFLGPRSVEREVRSADATRWVSAVAAVPAVRRELVAYQRRIALEHRDSGIVVEGRDIGSVVLPEAPMRIFLTASETARARRRAGDPSAIAAGDAQPDLEATRVDLRRRDRLDESRADTPAGVADGAIVVDSSDLDLEGVVELLMSLYRQIFLSAPEQGV